MKTSLLVALRIGFARAATTFISPRFGPARGSARAQHMTIQRSLSPLQRSRNIGISAHVDAGKTTLTERVLFYTGRIHKIGEVHDRKGRGATMDSLAAEKAHGITIRSAATRVSWRDHAITIIDTPGHADFTVEVERSLRVLDGAVFVFSAVEGVQAQSITVDRQMRRYGVPRVAFINKMDRVGANPEAVIADMRSTLGIDAVAIQLPLGRESGFEAVIDLLEQRLVRFEGERGQELRFESVPAALADEVELAREHLIDVVSRHDETLLELALEDEPISAAQLRAAIRRATLAHGLVPVTFGSAFHDQGVQPLLDAVVDYLPHPGEVLNVATDTRTDEAVELQPSGEAPAVGFVFKVDETRFGSMAYVRLYQGELTRQSALHSARTGKRVRAGRLLRLHADNPETIDAATAGEIIGVFGTSLASGDTLVGEDPGTGRALTLEVAGFEVPEPVVSRTLRAQDDSQLEAIAKVLARFSREDPSLRLGRDPESGLRLIAGTGALQLELYAERLSKEHGLQVELGAPQVAYRETITAEVAFEHLHRKQGSGGKGQYAGVTGVVRPLEREHGAYRFVSRIRGAAIPREYIDSVDRGFQDALEAGPLLERGVVGVEVELLDGKTHSVDSSDLAFRISARDALRKALLRAKPQLLEPLMRVEVDAPAGHFGTVQGSLLQRRGTILDSRVSDERVTLIARVPLAEMFDYATVLGTLTGGRAGHSMSMDRYEAVPDHIAKALLAAKAA